MYVTEKTKTNIFNKTPSRLLSGTTLTQITTLLAHTLNSHLYIIYYLLFYFISNVLGT